MSEVPVIPPRYTTFRPARGGEAGPGRALSGRGLYDFEVVKRLTVIAAKASSSGAKSSSGTKADSGAPKTRERRRAQRRLSIGRRLNERRTGDTPSELAEDMRRVNERRGLAQRRRLLDRRSGIRLLDLTNIDLSELDS